MKTALILFLFALTCRAELGVYAVSRTLISEDATGVVYKDKMSDGTFRNSQVAKPKIVLPEYPIRTTLIATNDTDRFFELVYESVYEGGRKSTNYTAVLKDKRDIIKSKLTMPPMPEESTNAPSRKDAFALAKNSVLGAPVVVTNTVKRMGKQEPRIKSSIMENGKVVHTMTDGSTKIEKLRTAHTAKVASSSKKEVPEPTGKSATFLLGFAAGVAAMGGAVAVKKAKG